MRKSQLVELIYPVFNTKVTMMCIHVFHIVPAVTGIHSRADCLYQFYTSSALFLDARPPWAFQLEAPGSMRSQVTGAIIHPSTQVWKFMLVYLAMKYLQVSVLLFKK